MHWVLYNVPAATSALPEGGDRGDLPPGTQEGINDLGHAGYGGPCPPIGRHRYFHKLYALDAVLTDLRKPNQGAIWRRRCSGHVLAEAQLVGHVREAEVARAWP